MFLNDFKSSGVETATKINKFLKEEFNISISQKTPSKKKLEKILETADLALNRLRNTNVYYQTHPEYAKYLGIKNAIRLMLQEGMYAESPAFMEMKKTLMDNVKTLMDSGYTDDEAVAECMNRYRMDNRYAYGDEYVLPVVINAAKQYMEQCKTESAQLEAMQEAEADVTGQGAPEFGSTNLKDIGLMELARECGISMEDTTSLQSVEKQLETFARASGKSRDAVVEFLNSLDETQILDGIQMFGRKVAEANAFVKSRRDAIRSGHKEFEVDGKTYKVTGDTAQEKSTNESMFGDIVDSMLSEDVDVQEAEVIMAVRALADDIQDHVERIGRMMNEDIPAIVDQMKHEMGAQTAQTFLDAANAVLGTYLESARTSKAGLDDAIGTLSGEQMTAAQPTEPAVDAAQPEVDAEVDVNEPAAAGPEDEPLGRAQVEI
jgi:arsenate reductase-like glutaredoxin family protein